MTRISCLGFNRSFRRCPFIGCAGLFAICLLIFPTHLTHLKPRDLIVDNHNREGIVVERANQPGEGWLHDQWDARVRNLPEDTKWWIVLPITGGAVIVAEQLVRFVREATDEDAMSAIEYANDHSIRTLANLFPETT